MPRRERRFTVIEHYDDPEPSLLDNIKDSARAWLEVYRTY